MRTYSWVSKLWHHSRVRESLYSLVVFWVNSSLYHFGIWAILSRYKDSCMVYRPEWYWNKYVVKNWYLTGIKMIWIPHYRYLDDIEKYDANPTLESTFGDYPNCYSKVKHATKHGKALSIHPYHKLASKFHPSRVPTFGDQVGLTTKGKSCN